MKAYNQLTSIFSTIAHLKHVQAITDWDEQTMMPPGGGQARAQALATLSSHIHEILIAPKNGELIEKAKTETLSNEWDCANLKWMEKIYREATCLPAEFVQKRTDIALRSAQAWRTLRQANNWKDFVPLFKELFDYVKREAEIKAAAFGLSPYDALIDHYSPGFNQAIITPIFDALKAKLPELIQTIMTKQQHQTVINLKGPFPVKNQKALGLTLMKILGFDFNHGRLDVSHHPFCGGVPTDVRITTRYNESEFITSAMAVCHETGHARYEQGLPREWLLQPVGQGLGMAMHESQSLLVEMQACRSREFMEVLVKAVIDEFGHQPGFTAENLYYCYTRVKPSYIRVDADEVTYPLHVILRYELEQQLFSGDLTIDDLPDAWNEKMKNYFNLETKNDFKNGVLQDVHWPSGIFGYFPAYTLGAIIAAQLFSAVKKSIPDILKQIQQGNFSSLFDWLRTHVHGRASSVDYSTLLIDATAEPLNPHYFLSHLEQRYCSGI